MEKIIVATRKNKEIYVIDNRCYKVFEKSFNKGNILNEALNHARVEETGLNIPRLLEVTMIDGQWAIVMERIDGVTMEELLETNPDKEDEYLDRFVDIQIDMQSRRCPQLKKHRDKMNSKISQTDLSATLRYDLHNRIESTPRHNSLCHGDYNPSNVIIDKDGRPYIIDWSHATQGNVEADAARTFLLFLLEGKNERAKKYLKKFCDRSGCNHKDVLNWLPILAASQSVKGRRNESDLLQRLIVENEQGLEKLYA